MRQNKLLLYALKSILPLCIFLCSQYTFAQTKFGVTAGAGKTSLYKFLYSPDDFDRYSGITTWWAGLTADVPIIKNSISFIAAPVFIKKGYRYLMQKDSGTVNSLKDSGFTQHLYYADLNLSLRKKFMFGEESANNFFIGTGPTAGFLVSGKEAVEKKYFGSTVPAVNSNNTKLTKGTGPGKYSPVVFSWAFNAGIEINNFTLGINMLIPITTNYQDAAKKIEHKLKTFGVSVGYSFTARTADAKKERKEARKEKHIKPDIAVTKPVAVDSLKDSDGDGIADVTDRCPGHKGTAKYFGCPVPDTDGDGINDDDDKCINDAGLAANKGCPAYPDTVAQSVNTDTTRFIIYFEPGKSLLRSDGFKTLSVVVGMLKANHKLVVLFKGHTDYVGSVDANYKRSLGRAEVCADYVSSFYINKNRLSVVSYGNTMPAADLLDPLLQWKNRRVEVCVFEKQP